MSFTELVATRERKVALALSAAALLALGFLPLFGGPTYEFGLAVGVLLPSTVAIATAVEVTRRAHSPREAFRIGLTQGGAHAALAFAVALLHGTRVGWCDPSTEFVWFLCGPLLGVAFGGVWGALAGVAAGASGTGLPSRALAVAFALLGPVASLLVSFLRFYQSPIVFAFDPFFGYFAGTLYDTEIEGFSRLLTHRLGTLGTTFALFALSRSFGDGPRLRFRPGFWQALGLGLGAAVGFSVAALGTRLGHVQTSASVREALGQVAVTERCEVVYAAGIPKRDAHALARECDAHVVQLERWFETQAAGRITVFLFASAAQKHALMGARNVYIAKPWRNEIYIHAQGYPHPVLRHELAHVVAAAFAPGPFAVAGPLGGWIPDPGRIEGYAEAAAPRDSDDLGTLAWAKAMRELELLPPLEAIFKLSFFGENSSKAYTVAGAFVEWLHTTRGAKAVRGWYAGQPLATVAGDDLGALEKEFHAALDALVLSDRALATAKARFDRPALFGRRCPHQIDALAGQALGALRERRTAESRALYERILELDATDFGARLGLAECAWAEGELAKAREAFLSLSRDPALTQLWRLQALERAADTKVLSGDLKGAREDYQAVANGLFDEDALRQLDVKLWLKPTVAPDAIERRAIVALLLGDPVLGGDWVLTGAELGRWSAADQKLGLADYLLGKNLFQRGRWEEASRFLDVALERSLPIASVRREALKTRMEVACALGQKARAKQVLDLQLEDPKLGEARRAWLASFAERCGVESR